MEGIPTSAVVQASEPPPARGASPAPSPQARWQAPYSAASAADAVVR